MSITINNELRKVIIVACFKCFKCQTPDLSINNTSCPNRKEMPTETLKVHIMTLVFINI